MKHLEKIEAHSRRLPESLQKEVLDFVCFLESRYMREQNRDRNPVSDHVDTSPDQSRGSSIQAP